MTSKVIIKAGFACKGLRRCRSTLTTLKRLNQLKKKSTILGFFKEANREETAALKNGETKRMRSVRVLSLTCRDSLAETPMGTSAGWKRLSCNC